MPATSTDSSDEEPLLSGATTPALEQEPEFTLRAVAGGLLIGALLCATNTYYGLQSGWISMMSLQASLVGFGLFKLLASALPKAGIRPLTVRENVVLQTTAVATGTLPLAAGLVGIIPAMEMLDPRLDGGQSKIVMGWVTLTSWCAAVAFFGVFLAVPLRRQVIVNEGLTFPSGTATAQIISVLHNSPIRRQPSTTASLRHRYRNVDADRSSYQALRQTSVDSDALLDREAGAPIERSASSGSRRKGSRVAHAIESVNKREWLLLGWSVGISAAFTLLSFAFPVLYSLPLFDLVVPSAASSWMWWFTPSFSYIGQGVIMGAPTTMSMSLGMLVGWGLLSPLAKAKGWAPGKVSSSANGSRGWLVWIALAIMITEPAISLGGVVARALQRLVSPSHADVGVDKRTHETCAKEDEPSPRLVGLGMLASCLFCVVIAHAIFGAEGIKWWATIIALGLACVFSLLGVRALGETDINPVSAIGKISQLVFVVVQPGNVVANLVAGGISEAGAQQAGDLMQDLKTGYLLGASPRAQFYGQMIGSLASVFLSSAIYIMYRNLYSLPSTSFPVPTAAVWLYLARLVNNGGHLPSGSQGSMLLFGALFFVLAGFKAAFRASGPPWARTAARWIPSGIGFAVGLLNTPSFSIARLIGGCISLYVSSKRARERGTEEGEASHLENVPLIIVASGFVLGEGAISVVQLFLRSWGVGPISCGGCEVGGGGGFCGGGC